MKLSTIAYLGLSTLLLGLMPIPAMGITIDLFNDVSDPDDDGNNPGQFQTVIDSSANSSAVSNIDSSITGIIGGQRTLQVNVLEKTGGSSNVNSVFEVDTAQGKASLSSADQIRPRATIKWDGNYGVNGIDLTGAGAQNSLLVNIASNDLGVTLNFTVKDINNNISTRSQAIASGVIGNQYFNYSNFTGTADLTKASFIQLETSNEPFSLDFGFEFVQTAQEVPFEFSPGLGIIMCGSFFGFRAIRKRLQTT